ncbi:hypothetical protein IWW34DRAFT_811662 [Fusarium oxysporum f. sp. albedinis]|uniref:Uncharacterized protein n=1 Tax=Fusarium oxysporum (strain Fo5176) TaxID=660025 RepID=F9GBZ0_FUSOF|nr:hypothetical protein FOXB_16173 [Fusarium oxysporum f. sp. conglutinans Fo5176]KAI3571711.1 hypothetical protein IWW34DRAFT_811662 [Fusarium oxysporum f. sp. albedinis]
MEQKAQRLLNSRDRSCFSTVTILDGIALAQIGSWSLCMWTSAVVLLLLENNDDAVISFEDLARDYESVEVVEILNGKAQSSLLILALAGLLWWICMVSWKLQCKSRK